MTWVGMSFGEDEQLETFQVLYTQSRQQTEFRSTMRFQTCMDTLQHLASVKLGLPRTGISMFLDLSSLTLLTRSDVLAIGRTQSICSDEKEKKTASPRVC